jgi:molybdopterin molybdotransferase
MGVLAALGHTKVLVCKKPRVNILATGDELVKVDEKPLEGQIRNSNSFVLAGYVHQSGGEPHLLGTVPDRQIRIRKAIENAPSADILLISGGVSVGEYDLVEEVLQMLGVKLVFQSVNIKPGRPFVFGRWGEMLVFGLPGNPVSAIVTFLQFVRPALWKMCGRAIIPPLRFPAVIEEELTKHDGKRHFVRGVSRQVEGKFHVRTTGSQNSGAMSSMVKANCLIIVPEAVTSIRPGDEVEIEML